ncbi:MAG: hypothetical protein P1U63_10455 [Coxiellaceae bacterium]|nr:hypothetical protein [Coxiellaceae bacterium]
MNIIDFFNAHLIFRFDEFKQYMQKREQGAKEKNCYMTLYNYCQKGKLAHVRKGLYVVMNEGSYQSSLIPPLLIAAKATDDAVLAYHTALEAHGVAYTDFNEHTYLTAKRTNTFSFQNQHYRAVYNPSVSYKKLGIEQVKKFGVTILQTTLERTIVDVLDRPNISGGWEEVFRSVEHIVLFNEQFAVDYALSLKRASIVSKLGYFFDRRPEHLLIDPNAVERLLLHIPKRPYYIDRKSTVGKGTYIKKWQLIVPDYLHNQQWEEPGNDIDY